MLTAQPLHPELHVYLEEHAQESERIPAQRQTELQHLAELLAEQHRAHHRLDLLFVCTHNSRRSQMGQLWAWAAAQQADIPGVVTHSGGTEGTAFNPRAVAALRRAGWPLVQTTFTPNPTYLTSVSDSLAPVQLWSKRFEDAAVTPQAFTALMVCAEADAACPVVPGAAARFSLPYIDPKRADNTPEEAAAYDATCAEIAREMVYLMDEVKQQLQ